MQRATFGQYKFSPIVLCWIILLVYFFIAFIPIPDGIGVGLDQSWSYAISRAAADKLVFGKDIIFTYGPLGYLISGAALEQNVFLVAGFRFIVYVVLFVITFLKVIKLKTNLPKIALSLSIFLPVSTGLSSDYQIIFIFIIILSEIDSLSSKSIRWCYLGLGIFSGFCLLTKFTLGVYTLGSLILFTFGNFYKTVKSNLTITVSLFTLIDLLLSSISTAFLLLAPDFYLLNFIKITISLTLSYTAGVFARLIQERMCRKDLAKTGEKFTRNRLSSNNLRIQLISWFSFYTVYCFCLFITLTYSSPSLLDYLRNSLEISSGYSSAMSIVGSHWILGLAVSELAFISIALVFVAREGNLNFALAMLLILALAFKHGFVRQDGHIMAFAWCTPLIISLCMLKVSSVRVKDFLLLLHIYVLFLLLVFHIPSQVNTSSIYQCFSPSRIFSHLSYVFSPSTLQSNLQASSANSLALSKLPETVTNLVRSKKVDIIPWEISLVPANHLNWKPRPIFQSYLTYTTYLDKINFESLSTEPRDYIFYQFLSIDDRHPFFDEPKTFFYVSCNYQLSSSTPDFINLRIDPLFPSAISKHIVLEKHKFNLCSPSSLSRTVIINWNTSQFIETNDGSITRAAIKFKYSTFGKIYKALFRSPPVMMQVTYADGFKRTYRIIPENSENGIIISHLPKDDNEAISFFRGQLPAQVKSFSFHANNSLLYSPTIEIVFLSSKKQSF